MGRSAARIVVHAVVVALLVSVAVLSMLELTAGDPAYALLGEGASAEAVAEVRVALGLDRPFHQRYVEWLGDLVHGDLGTSFRNGASVSGLVAGALATTAELVVGTLLLALLVAVPVGSYAAYRVGGRVDRLMTVLSSVLVSVPPFVSGPIVAYVLVVQLGAFPSGGWVPFSRSPLDNLSHAFIPILVLALVEVPVFANALRADMVATLRQDFILNARAKGMPPRVVLFRHALRPSSFALVTLAGVSLGRLIGGAVIVEMLFGLPGLGSLLVGAIQGKDIPIVQGVVLFVAVTYVAVNALTDVAYRYLDPRVGHGAA